MKLNWNFLRCRGCKEKTCGGVWIFLELHIRGKTEPEHLLHFLLILLLGKFINTCCCPNPPLPPLGCPLKPPLPPRLFPLSPGGPPPRRLKPPSPLRNPPRPPRPPREKPLDCTVSKPPAREKEVKNTLSMKTKQLIVGFHLEVGTWQTDRLEHDFSRCFQHLKQTSSIKLKGRFHNLAHGHESLKNQWKPKFVNLFFHCFSVQQLSILSKICTSHYSDILENYRKWEK